MKKPTNLLLKTVFFITLSCTLDANSQCNPSDVFDNDSTNAVCIENSSNVRTIISNNFPNHPWGNWPSGSPVLAQEFTYYVCRYPEKSSTSVSMYDSGVRTGCGNYIQFGVGLNGIFFAGWGARWFVNPNTLQENFDWNVEPTVAFNMDFNNAHSNGPGEFHYHGTPTVYLVDSMNIDGSAHSSLVGYAADGFPVYYKYVYASPMDPNSGLSQMNSGYTLIPGNRPGDGITEPDGLYDGYYVEDYEYSNSNTELDECNGRFGVTPDYPNGTYYYVLTDNWPYMPRCFYGTALDKSFVIGQCPSSTSAIDCSDQNTSSVISLNDVNFQIQPNPAQETVHIVVTDLELENEIKSISLYDLNGLVVFQSEVFTNSINISSFSRGTYFLQITTKNAQITKKLLIQ